VAVPLSQQNLCLEACVQKFSWCSFEMLLLLLLQGDEGLVATNSGKMSTSSERDRFKTPSNCVEEGHLSTNTSKKEEGGDDNDDDVLRRAFM